MKTKLATALLSLTAALGFAQEASFVQPMHAPKIDEQPAKRGSFSYARLGVADSDTIHQFETLPTLGAGYRLASGGGAFDFGASYTRAIKSGDQEHYSYTAPKVSYLRYWDSAADQTAYAGLGLGWMGIRKADVANFDGLAPSATVGMEMNRHQKVRTFVQLDVFQPAVRVSSWNDYSTDNLPNLGADFSVGVGF